MRWSNVPIPEPHLAVLAGAAALHWLMPVRLSIGRATGLAIGIPMIVGGAGFAVWAVASAGDTEVESDAQLVTDGAYALTRNPMYVGWSAAVLGVALVARSGWLVAGWILAVRALDREIHAEESRLLERFGTAYEAYLARIPRYLAIPTSRS